LLCDEIFSWNQNSAGDEVALAISNLGLLLKYLSMIAPIIALAQEENK
jgi:hypothetical protein